MKRMQHLVKFGVDVDGYSVPVLNEREIRASAGILFVLMFTALMFVIFRENFLIIKYVIVVFLVDFIIRLFLSPEFSPLLILGRLIVSRQVPEYVGAAQKKFAWKIGLAISALMFFLLIILNSYSVVAAVCCFACLTFLFFESSFGICLGCVFYRWFYKREAEYCAGESCEKIAQSDIQKTSLAQLVIFLCFGALLLVTGIFFNDVFSTAPTSLWKILSDISIINSG